MNFFYDDKLHYEKLADGTIKNIEEEIPFDIPNTWSWCRLRDVGEVCSSKRILQSDWRKNGIPFYRAREIVKLCNQGFINNDLFIDEIKFEEILRTSPYSIPQYNDIMISAVGTIGKTYIVKRNDKFYYKDASVLCFKPSKKLYVEFLKIILDSPFIQKQMIDCSNGTTVDTITIDTSKNYLICLPPLSEQERIVSKIEELFKQVDAIEEEKQSLLKLIDKAKDKVLDLAMTGKLVKPDPNDEPASKLLEKIFEEKKKLAKEGKIKLSKDELLTPPTSVDNDYYKKLSYNTKIKWCQSDIRDVLYYEQPTAYIVKSSKYNNTYKTPVLTAGKSFILGYTNENTGIFNNIPCIIFDDFTTDTKYVDFPFKVKSSAMKILKNNIYTNIKYLYYFIRQIEVINNTHKRYWISDFSKRKMILPPKAYQDKVVMTINNHLNSLNTIKAELN